jgi:polyisoprenoid-binding protein YceI
MTRRNAALASMSLAAAGLAVAGFGSFTGAENAEMAEALDMEAMVVAPTYSVDSVHSGATFSIRHAGVSNFRGRFDTVNGEFTFDPSNPSSGSFRAELPIESVNTGNGKRDDHLKAADFFNARQYPVATFESTGIAPTGEENVFDLSGNLTLHGTTKAITAKLTWIGTGQFRGNDVAGFDAEFSIKRGDFGITTYLAPDGGEGGGLGNTVSVTMFVEGVKQ